jgi:hypothetical protein
MSIIEKLRGFRRANGNMDDTYYEIDDILGAYKPDGYSVKDIKTEFEEGSRWSNWKKTVFKVTENGEEAYFSFDREVPASECQEGMDLFYFFYEVVPQEVKVMHYVVKKEAE